MRKVNDMLEEVKDIKRKYLYTALKVNDFNKYSFESKEVLSEVLNDDKMIIGALELHTYRNNENPISMKIGRIVLKTKDDVILTLVTSYKR